MQISPDLFERFWDHADRRPDAVALAMHNEFMMIDTDGSVRFCYKAWENPQDSLFEKPLSDIWNSDTYQRIRASVNTEKPSFNYCSICSSTQGMSRQTSHLHKSPEEENYYSFNWSDKS